MADKTHYDFLVVGSGIAGLFFAIKASKYGSVAVLTKNKADESNTNYAQGGIACVTSEEDTFELHVKDTLNAGAGLCHEDMVRMIVAEGPERIQELVHLNIQFTERKRPRKPKETELDLGKEGGHTKRRILHAGDITGQEIQRSLLKVISQSSNIDLFENHYVIDLITSHKLKLEGENRCLGLYCLNHKTGRVKTFRSAVTVLATGGCGKTYLYTTNPAVATGDGIAIAWRAGVPVCNMEFIQFHPTCLYHPERNSFLLSEALRGEGAILVNEKGEDFVRKSDPRGSLAPRDIVARAIDAEMKSSGAKTVFLDITSKKRGFLKKRFPNIYRTCLELGMDLSKQPAPVVPAAHYQCGGIVTNKHGATPLRALYAIGEVAHTGLHGANRLASNSLLEAVVMAHRACTQSSQELSELKHNVQLPQWEAGKAQDADELVIITHNWKEIRQLMWDYVGIVRTNKRLLRALKRLQLLSDEIHEFYWNFKVTGDLLELRNLVLTSALIVESALRRKESRGLHYTADYPHALEQAKDTVLRPNHLKTEVQSLHTVS